LFEQLDELLRREDRQATDLVARDPPPCQVTITAASTGLD
jgi:hypothetical protein